MLRKDQHEYEAEGVVWTPVEYHDNQAICEMIDGVRHTRKRGDRGRENDVIERTKRSEKTIRKERERNFMCSVAIDNH